jgi:hypothetical protein
MILFRLTEHGTLIELEAYKPVRWYHVTLIDVIISFIVGFLVGGLVIAFLLNLYYPCPKG